MFALIFMMQLCFPSILQVIKTYIKNSDPSDVSCLVHQVEQLELGSNISQTTEVTMDDNDNCLPATSEKIVDGDCLSTASENIVDDDSDEYVLV
jgi:hypothetical protein